MSKPATATKDITIGDITPGNQIEGIYLLASVEQRSKKNGDPFFMVQLSDSTGTINGVMWDNHASLLAGTAQKDDFVRVSADAGEYNGFTQLTLKKIHKVEDTEVDVSRFLPVSPRSREEMEAELDAWIERVQNPDCRRLLDRFFKHKRLREMYCTAPAAARIHQAYIHGLLEHTLNVLRIADTIASLYEPINRDVLITAGLLHDVGKIRELDWRRTITYTTEGRLMGHIPMGASMVDASINELRKQPEGFDQQLQWQIIHLILSHHGKLEYGSPVRPQTREAQAFHFADHAEAYMAVFATETQKAADRGAAWTPYSKMFDTYLYAGSIQTLGGNVPSAEDLAYADDKPQTMDEQLPTR